MKQVTMSRVPIPLPFLIWSLVVSSLPVSAQRSNTAAIRAKLSAAAALTPADIPDVLQAAREAVAYRTLRLSISPTGLPGPEVMMDSDGRPKFIQSTTGSRPDAAVRPQPPITSAVESLTHYTRQAARYCDGQRAPGELVLEYEQSGRGWDVRARHSMEGLEPLGPIFATLTGEVALADMGHATVGDRRARHFVAPWRPLEVQSEERLPGGGITRFQTFPAGPPPADATEHLWIDEQTILPLRWSVTMTPPGAPAPVDYGMFFVFDRAIELRPPATREAPTCIDGGR